MPQSWPKGTGYDYFAPFVRAALVARDGKRLPIWTNLGDDGAPNAEFSNVYDKTGIGSIPFLASASVRITRGWVPYLSVTLTPPYREGIDLLDSVFAEFAESQLELTMGYFSSNANHTLISSPTWRGVTKAPKINIGFETTITINAVGTGGFRAMTGEVNSLPQNTSRRNLIEGLLGASADAQMALISTENTSTAGSDPVALALIDQKPVKSTMWINFNEADKDPAVRARLDALVSITGGYKTPLDLTLTLLRDAGCVFRLETIKFAGIKEPTDVMWVLPESRMATEPAKATFYAYDYPQGQVGPLVGAYPILSASSGTGAAFATGHTFYAVDVDSGSTGKTLQLGMSAEETVRSTDGVVRPNLDSGLIANGVTGWFGNPAANGARERMRAALQAHTGSMAIAMDIATLGAPDIFPEDIVKLHGLGNRFSGKDHNYTVVVVEHTIDSNGFNTKLKLVNNAFMSPRGLAAGTTAKEAGAQANTTEAAPAGAGVTAYPVPGAVGLDLVPR